MIIFGTRGVTTTPASGSFFCPSCNNQTGYKHKRVRRFFTLYFIPVIPLDQLGEYIECQRCRNTYQMRVLDYNPQVSTAKLEAEFHQAVKRVMVQMMLADGVVDDQEVQTIREIYSKVARTDMSENDVQAEIEKAKADGRTIEQYLSGLAGNLNDAGKELVVQAAFFVAAADGVFQDEEKELLTAIGKALYMTPAHLRGVLQSITAPQ